MHGKTTIVYHVGYLIEIGYDPKSGVPRGHAMRTGWWHPYVWWVILKTWWVRHGNARLREETVS